MEGAGIHDPWGPATLGAGLRLKPCGCEGRAGCRPRPHLPGGEHGVEPSAMLVPQPLLLVLRRTEALFQLYRSHSLLLLENNNGVGLEPF